MGDLRQAVALASVANDEDFLNIEKIFCKLTFGHCGNSAISALNQYLIMDVILDRARGFLK